MNATERAWSPWVSWGAVAVAGLGAISLAATVLVALQGAREAEPTLARGEVEEVFLRLRHDLRRNEGLPDRAWMDRALKRLAPMGLRCLETLTEQGPQRVGEAACEGPPPRPGVQSERGGLVVVSAPLPPGLGGDWGGPPPLMTVGVAPPVTARLEQTLRRVVVVSGAAALLLLGFAALVTRNTLRQASQQRELERSRRLRALGEMSSVMAHELRNPLASLKGHAQLLLESLPQGRDRGRAERVVNEARRIERLTSDLLDFVRDGPLDRRPIEVAALIERLREAEPQAELVADLSAAPSSLVIDAPRILTALGNLLRNARQASEAPVELSVRAQGKAVVVEVRDRGPGLPPGQEERIFEPFVTERTRGTGLGLAVARRAAEQHGGTLRGETAPGGGARFTLVLPGAAGPN